MNIDDKGVLGRPLEQAFSVKALSVGIGLGELRPVKGSKFKIRQEDCPVVNQPIMSNPSAFNAQMPLPLKPIAPAVPTSPQVSVGNLNEMRRSQLRPRERSGRKWWLDFVAHIIDLSVVVVSAGMVILAFGILSRQAGDGIGDMFRDSLSFWVGKFSYLEIILMIYGGLLIYWMIFRLVAGHTIGQSLRLESMNWSKVRGLMRNGQQS